AQLHGGADELGGHDDGDVDHRFVDLLQLAARPVGGVVDVVLGAVLGDDAVVHRRGGGDEVEVELALQAVAGDLHVEQAEEAAAETEAQGDGGLRLPGEG